MASVETFAQFFILCRHTDRAGIHMAFAHHHTPQYDQCGGGKAKLFGSQQGHQYDVASGFQLPVCLQADLSAQTVHDQCLLCFRQSQFGRQSGITDRADWRSTCSAFGSGDDDAVCFRFGYTCRDGSDATFRNQLDADLRFRIDILEVEDQLCQIFDRIDIMVGRRGDQRDARNGMTRLCNDVVHLVPRQLPAFSRLGSLGHLDLYFICIYQVFRCYAETSRCHLFDGRAER